MLSDEERAALDAAVRAFAATGDGDGLDEVAFAAGIAYAQTWRSMESAPIGQPVLLRLADGSRVIGRWCHGDAEIELVEGWFDDVYRVFPTGWLPLPPTQEAK